MAVLKPGAGQRPCRVALVGFGTVGQSVARLMLDLKPRELELVAICNRDISRKRVDWILSSVRWTETFAEVLTDDVDVVVELIGGRTPAADRIRGAPHAAKCGA